MNTIGWAVLARGLRKRYGGIAAVSGIDLEIAPGEVFALLGPNGAGKTTTVEILEGYRDRDGGEVSVLGADPQRAGRAWRARIGIVLQLAADVPELTVAEMVGHFAGFYPSPRRPAEVVDLVGLTSQGRTRIHALSGGQLRRLDVALGLIGGPELLFLDEPTTGFDPAATVRLGYDPDAIWLEVSDDGAGFDPARVSGGYGLHGMRTRVAEAGGTLTVRTSPGAGTRVSAMVPA